MDPPELAGLIERLDALATDHPAHPAPTEAKREHRLHVLPVDTPQQAVDRLVDVLILDGLKHRAQIVYIVPTEKDLRVHLRVDGQLRHDINPPTKLRDAIAERLIRLARINGEHPAGAGWVELHSDDYPPTNCHILVARLQYGNAARLELHPIPLH